MIRVSRRRICKPWPSLVFVQPAHWSRRLHVRAGTKKPLAYFPFYIHGLPRWRTPRWNHLMISAARNV